MLKYASAQIMTKALAPQDASARELRRFAHRHRFEYKVRPGYLYVRSRAISSRCNDNFDEFPAEELAKSYASFKGKPVFVNHHNEDHKRARGVIIDAVLHKDSNRDGTRDWWVEVLMEVDALRFPKLAAEIMNGNIARTSMGTDVAYSICSACGNKATTPAEYCRHIPGSKGQMLYRTTASGQKVGEIIRETCYGLKFFENSLLVEPPADPTAHFLGVDTRGVDKTATKIAAHAYSWDEIGQMHPHLYGEAGDDSWGIGDAANHLAHDREEDPEAEGSDVSEMRFHFKRVKPSQIDHQRHERGDDRVQHAEQGYRQNPEQVPPLVLVHRHGVYQVADGHHRAAGAKAAGVSSVPAYVAYSPHEDEPFSDGSSAPFHGAAKSPATQPGRKPVDYSGPGHEQPSLFEAKHTALSALIAEAMNQEGGEMPAFPWDRVPKGELVQQPRQQGWDDPDRKTLHDNQDQPGYEFANRYLTEPHGLPGRPGRTPAQQMHPATIDHPDMPDQDPAAHRYPGVTSQDSRRIRHAWDQNERQPDSPDREQRRTQLRSLWHNQLGQPMHCTHNDCAPWETHGAPDPFDIFMNPKQAAQQYPNPADHPWFKETGLSHENVLSHWDQATPEEKAQGKRWYPDAHLVAKSIAKLDTRIKTDKEAAHKGAGVLSAYSPQQNWWANQHNAARSFHEQRALGKGEGIMIMSSHAKAAQRIMDGEDHQKVLKGPKTADFAHLIEHGGNDEDGNPSQKVVIDRHALSVAAGRRLNADDVKGFPSQNRHYYEHAAEHYRRAAAVISDREGRTVPPHEVQATTWLVRQRLNSEGDSSPGQKGRDTMQRNQREQWRSLTHEQTPELHEPPANSHVAGANGDLPEGVSFSFHKQYNAPNVHGVEAHVPNPAGGDPIRAGYMQWDPQDGTIGMIETHRDYRRQGIGDALLNRAHEMAQTHGLAAPRRSPVVFDDGKAWNGHARVAPQDFSANPTRVAEPPQAQHQDWNVHAQEHGISGTNFTDEATYRAAHDAWHRYNVGPHHVHGSRKLAYGADDDADDDYEVNGDNGAAHWRGRDKGGADCASCGYPVTYEVPQRNPLAAGWRHADGMKRDHAAAPADGRTSDDEWSRNQRNNENARKLVDQHMQTAFDRRTFNEMTKGLHGARKTAYGETKAPQDVDTLREDACPVCGDRDTFDGATCQVCGYVAPPKMFQDPDLEKARQMDLRKDIAEFQDPANPNQIGPDGQPIQDPANPDALDENGNPVNPDAADPNAQPGTLPGEVQAEVQPGGDPMGGGSPLDPAALGPDGQPQDPAMLGPDGQPLQQPGQQQMIGPNGEPIGPQALPADAVSSDGKPFTPGPNMPTGPGEPEGPEGPLDPSEMDPDGQVPNPDAGQGVPGTPGDGVPDLQCPACGFTADATPPTTVNMDTSIMPPTGEATPDGVQAGDICPNCGQGQLISPAEGQGETPLPMPV